MFRPKYVDHLQGWFRILFRSKGTETDLSIWIPTEISRIFGLMESTLRVLLAERVHRNRTRKTVDWANRAWRQSYINCAWPRSDDENSIIVLLSLLHPFVRSRFTETLRLVLTGNGVVIRSLERDDLVKIKPTELEAEHWLCLLLRRLWSTENCIVGVASRSGRINQWQCSIPGFAIGWFFRFCFRLRQPSFHSLYHKRRSRKRNRKKWKRSDSSDSDSVELMTPLTTPIFTRS